MALWHIARRCCQKIQAAFNLFDDFVAREQMHPSGGQFDTKRHTIDQTTDLINGR